MSSPPSSSVIKQHNHFTPPLPSDNVICEQSLICLKRLLQVDKKHSPLVEINVTTDWCTDDDKGMFEMKFNQGFKPEKDDWIALYQVGFRFNI